MNLLLDTHVVVWAFSNPNRIPRPIRDLIGVGAERVVVSHLTLWEIGMKYPLNRRDAPPRSAAEALRDVAKAGFDLLPLAIDHILTFERVPILHGDPMDRLLVAQAMVEGLSLVTHDRRLAAYGDSVISW